MSKLVLTTGDDADFFARGRELAKLADQELTIPEEMTLSFEDPLELFSLMTKRRIHLLQEIKKNPGTVAQISAALGRSQSSVKKDINILERAGIVSLTTLQTSAMRDSKLVKITAKEISLVAVIL